MPAFIKVSFRRVGLYQCLDRACTKVCFRRLSKSVSGVYQSLFRAFTKVCFRWVPRSGTGVYHAMSYRADFGHVFTEG